ncbi:hypothetical protein NC652_002958 [Populus alba x Populus x berolinensis]|nr:hypothetical protein NC652_002958 [Populus alba x Populus x berolinensis]
MNDGRSSSRNGETPGMTDQTHQAASQMEPPSLVKVASMNPIGSALRTSSDGMTLGMEPNSCIIPAIS